VKLGTVHRGEFVESGMETVGGSASRIVAIYGGEKRRKVNLSGPAHMRVAFVRSAFTETGMSTKLATTAILQRWRTQHPVS
jgi:hypothetical protein